jgi:hypothetical protein
MKVMVLDKRVFVVKAEDLRKMDGMVDVEVLIDGKKYYWANTKPFARGMYELIYLSYEPTEIELGAVEEESAIEHYLKEEIRIMKELLDSKDRNLFFNGVPVGYERSVKLMKKHIIFCEHLLKLIAKGR